MWPTLFADLEFATALERATAEHNLLLVDATAAWCGPCQMMDRSTWVDPEVTAWVRAHGLAIQVDVDEQKEVARELRIQSMPTIIAFINGKEFDRVVGAKKPKELLAWLEGVTRGETSLVVVERRVRREPADNLAGTVTVEFTLVGEPGVVGLLESSAIVEKDTTITQQTIRDCLIQQLYALELDPPPDGVTVKRAISIKVP
jgi:thioredoxin 1